MMTQAGVTVFWSPTGVSGQPCAVKSRSKGEVDSPCQDWAGPGSVIVLQRLQHTYIHTHNTHNNTRNLHHGITSEQQAKDNKQNKERKIKQFERLNLNLSD